MDPGKTAATVNRTMLAGLEVNHVLEVNCILEVGLILGITCEHLWK